MKNRKRDARANLAITEAVRQIVTVQCAKLNISESQWWRAAGNKLILFLETHGESAIYPYFKDVTEEDIHDLKEQAKKVIDLSHRRRGTFSDGALFGITEESIQAAYVVGKATHLAVRYMVSRARKCYSSTTSVSRPGAKTTTERA